MASIDLAEYKANLDRDPEAPNTGPWFAKSRIEHDGKAYAPGARLPELKNREVSQLLDVNVVTSVDPSPKQDQAPQGPSDTDLEQGPGSEFDENGNPTNPATPPSGTTRLDENGNPVA